MFFRHILVILAHLFFIGTLKSACLNICIILYMSCAHMRICGSFVRFALRLWVDLELAYL